MTKIVLITSGQPSLNPRLVKEADILADNGFDVTVIFQFWNSWGTDLDHKLLANKKWKAIRIDGDPIDERVKYWKSRFFLLIGKSLIKYFGLKNGLAELALSRNTYKLIKIAKSIPASLYIAHNLGALPAAVLASEKKKAKCGFDAEDFHRQEVSDNETSSAYQLTSFIENKYFPKVDYLTVASPLIAIAYRKIYPAIVPVIINNVFSTSSLQKVVATERKNLKLFWFSQTIGKHRGIEDAIKAIGLLKKYHISLTLLGNIDESNQNYFLDLANDSGLTKTQLIFIAPVAPDDIFELANDYDIGLALEQNTPLNRDICLTNKIFTYLTSGLAIIASETSAQKNFMMENPLVGQSYLIGDIQVLSKIIDAYDKNRDFLHQTKLAAHQLAKEKLNWENESKKFIQLIEKTIAS